jgi:hypothetical protein
VDGSDPHGQEVSAGRLAGPWARPDVRRIADTYLIRLSLSTTTTQVHLIQNDDLLYVGYFRYELSKGTDSTAYSLTFLLLASEVG